MKKVMKGWRKLLNENAYAMGTFGVNVASGHISSQCPQGEEQNGMDEFGEPICRPKPEVDEKALKAFWAHNRAYSNVNAPKKRKKRVLTPKVDFCLIHWTKPPSDYDDKPAMWYVKRGPIWMITTSLKNK